MDNISNLADPPAELLNNHDTSVNNNSQMMLNTTSNNQNIKKLQISMLSTANEQNDEASRIEEINGLVSEEPAPNDLLVNAGNNGETNTQLVFNKHPFPIGSGDGQLASSNAAPQLPLPTPPPPPPPQQPSTQSQMVNYAPLNSMPATNFNFPLQNNDFNNNNNNDSSFYWSSNLNNLNANLTTAGYRLSNVMSFQPPTFTGIPFNNNNNQNNNFLFDMNCMNMNNKRPAFVFDLNNINTNFTNSNPFQANNNNNNNMYQQQPSTASTTTNTETMKLNSIVEMMTKQDSTAKLANRTVYVDPSPSGITRIHINHFNTNGSVTDKIKEVSEKLKINRPNEESYLNLLSPQKKNYIDMFQSSNQQFNNPSFQSVVTNNNNNNQKVFKLNLPVTSPQAQPLFDLNNNNRQKYEEVNRIKRDICTSPIRILKSKNSDEEDESINDDEREPLMYTDQLPPKVPHFKKSTKTITVPPVVQIENHRAENVHLEEVQYYKSSKPDSLEPIYKQSKEQPKRLEKSKMIVVNLTPKPDQESSQHEVAINTTTNPIGRSPIKKLRSALKETRDNYADDDNNAELVEMDDLRGQRLYAPASATAASQTSAKNVKSTKFTMMNNRANRIEDGDEEEDEDEEDEEDDDANNGDEIRGNERDNMNILTPLSTRSSRSDDSKSDSVKKRRSSDDNNMLTGKSSNYYNDVRREQAEPNEKKDSKGYLRKQIERMSPSRKGGFRRMAYSKLESVAGSREEITRLGGSNENVANFNGNDENNDEHQQQAMMMANKNNNNKLRYYRMDNIDVIEEEPQQPNLVRADSSPDDPSTASSRGFRRFDVATELTEVNEKDLLSERKQSIERFYNGRESWSMPLDGERRQDPEAMDAIVALDSKNENEENAETEEDRKLKKKRNLKVKIKLPTENFQHFPRLKPKKERNLQKCCLVLFLLTLFMIVTGILLYFFAWGFVQPKLKPDA